MLTPFCRAIAAHDAAAALRLVTSELVHVRADAGDFWLAEIGHHVYVGDTALHVAAAAHEACSTPRALALRPTGRGGSGSSAARAQLREIVDLLGVAHLPTHP